MGKDTLSFEVEEIVRRLSRLAGSHQFSIQTRRYPRSLPDQTHSGFEEHSWSFGIDMPRDIAIPADSEDVVVTCIGKPNSTQTKDQVREALGSAIGEMDCQYNWDFSISSRNQAADESELIVQVFRTF